MKFNSAYYRYTNSSTQLKSFCYGPVFFKLREVSVTGNGNVPFLFKGNKFLLPRNSLGYKSKID